MRSLIFKTVIGSLITLGAFVAVIFIFGESDPLTTDGARKNPTPRLESVSDLKMRERVIASNATQEIAKQLAADLIAENPEGPILGEYDSQLAGLNPQLLAEKVIEDTFSHLSLEDLRPTINSALLVISDNATKSDEERYFNLVNQIIAKNFPASLNTQWTSPEKTKLTELISALESVTNELLRLPVPKKIFQMHRELITLIGAQRNALTLLKNYKVDPAQATIAIEAGERFTTELELIFDEMDAYIIEHQIILAAN